MNVIYIAYSCNPFAGSEDKIGWCVPFESAKINNVFVVTKKGSREHVERYLKNHTVHNITFYYVDIPNLFNKIFKGFLLSGRLNLWNKRALKVARTICQNNKIDIIHQITPVEFRAIGDYGKVDNVKFVCGPIGGSESVPKGLKEYTAGHKKVETVRAVMNYWYRFKFGVFGKLKQCDYLMFANKETEEFVKMDKVSCLYEIQTEIGLRQDELSVSGEKNNNECIFLAAGRMIYRKGFDFLLDALSRIPESVQYQVRVVGKGPELERYRARCANDAMLSRHVTFVGSVPYAEMEKEYINASAFIMPSIRETTGTVLLEALSKGLPIIAVNRFGARTILDENVAWLFDGEDKEAFIENLKNAIIDCASNSSERIRRGKLAREKAEDYTWPEKMKKIQAIYENLQGDRCI